MNRVCFKFLAALIYAAAAAGLYAEQQDAPASSQADADRIGQLEKDYQNVLSELDQIKRQSAEQESPGMTQKDQWGQGFGLLFGINQIVGLDFIKDIMPETLIGPHVPYSFSLIFPAVDLGVGFRFQIDNSRGLSDVYLGLKPKIRFSSPLMFNFSKTYWGLGIDASTQFLSAHDNYVQFGSPSLFTGLEIFVEKNRSFYWETGFTGTFGARWDFNSSGMDFSWVSNPVVVLPYMEMGLRFYF
jgi:hypothetical protein